MKISRITTLFLTLLLILAGSADAGPAGDLRGPAFSDPSETQEMPAGWDKKPISYKESAAGADLVVDLNQQLYSILLPHVNKFAAEHNLKIVVTKGTCGKSGGLLGRKETDIGSFCCPPAGVDRLPGLRFHTLGIIPLALLINPENPVEDITLSQARKIFMGEISRWSEVNGPDWPIKTIGSIHCMAKPGDWRLLLAHEDYFSPHLLEVGDLSDMIFHVANTPKAIGYEVLLVADRFRDQGLVKALKINGLHPQDLSHMQIGDYPFYRTFNMTTWEGEGTKNTFARKLVDHLLKKVEQIDSVHGLVPASKLRKSGWKFKNNELIGEPD